jgi:hypothetical protein
MYVVEYLNSCIMFICTIKLRKNAYIRTVSFLYRKSISFQVVHLLSKCGQKGCFAEASSNVNQATCAYVINVLFENNFHYKKNFICDLLLKNKEFSKCIKHSAKENLTCSTGRCCCFRTQS